MDGADEDAQACSKPSWFTPGRLLLIFCTTNLMVYLDRGALLLLPLLLLALALALLAPQRSCCLTWLACPPLPLSARPQA